MVDIPDPPGFRHPAQAAYFKYGGLDAVIVTVHLTWSDRSQRAKERQLLACIAQKALEIDPDVIIAGDFNTTEAPGDTLHELVSSTGLIPLIDPHSETGTTYTGKHYDQILVSPDLFNEEAQTKSCGIFEFYDVQKASAISDHRPLVAEFKTDSTYGDCESWPPDLSQFHWDCSPLPPPGTSCTSLHFGDVVIYKLLVNAPGSTATTEIPYEYWTLLNTTNHTVDLRGLTLSDEQSSWTIPSSMTDAVIGPGETWTVYGSTYNPTRNSRGIALRNSGETVSLRCNGTLIDLWKYPGGSREGVPITRPGY